MQNPSFFFLFLFFLFFFVIKQTNLAQTSFECGEVVVLTSVDPSINFFLNLDGLKTFWLIFGLAEFTQKVENLANLQQKVNNCG